MKKKVSKKIIFIVVPIIILLIVFIVIYILKSKNDFEGVTASITTNDNGVVTVGESSKGDALIIKSNKSKKVEWKENLETERGSRFDKIIETSDKNFIVAGTFFSRTVNLNNGKTLENPDYFEEEIPQLGIQTPSSTMLIKYDKDGNVLWGEFLGSENITITDILATYDGGFILGGALNGDLKMDNKTVIKKTNSDDAYKNAVLLKFNSNGEIVWDTSAIAGKKLAASDMHMNYTEILSLKLVGNKISVEMQVGSRTDSMTLEGGTEITKLYDSNSNSTKKILVEYDMNGKLLKYQKEGDQITEISTLNKNIGDKVDYSITVNNVNLDKWRVFYSDGNKMYVIYEEYLPNSTQVALGAGLTQGKDMYSKYGVYSDISKSDFFNKLNDVRNKGLWNRLLTPQLVSIGATAKGAVDIETWVKSWNLKGYSELTVDTIDFSDGTKGYKVLESELSTSTNNDSSMLNLSSDTEGYSDSLYFPNINDDPDVTNIGNPYYGYWIASPSAIGDGYMMIATDEGELGNNLHGYYNSEGVGIRPIICIPLKNLKKSETNDKTWEINV